MKNATKKWLIVAGGLAACAALVFIIAGQFEKKPVNDTLPPPSSSSQGGVMVDEPDSSISPEKDDPEITVKPETPDTSSTPETGNSGSGAVASGTEQTIQGDPEKPEYDDEALKDPTQKPDGTPVEGKPDAEDHDTVEPPPPPPSTNTSGGLPGFDSVVQKMLCNEKYIGDALLQKTYIADLFTREKRVNNGELPKYYVHDCHPAIIDRETFQKVQEEIARRSSLKKTSSKAKTQLGKYCGKYVLSELLVCGECGSPYRRVIWTQKGAKRVVWRCQNRLEHGRKICKQSPTLDEGDIHDAVISAMNELFRMQAAKDAVKAGIAAVLAGEEQTLSLPAVEHQIRNLQERQLELFQLIVSAGADCTDYDEELQQVYMAKTKLMAQKAELEKEHRGAAAFDSRLAELDMALEQASGALTDFDELTVRQLVSNIKVLDKDSLLICFKDGTEITQTIQRRRSA